MKHIGVWKCLSLADCDFQVWRVQFNSFNGAERKESRRVAREQIKSVKYFVCCARGLTPPAAFVSWNARIISHANDLLAENNIKTTTTSKGSDGGEMRLVICFDTWSFEQALNRLIRDEKTDDTNLEVIQR